MVRFMSARRSVGIVCLIGVSIIPAAAQDQTDSAQQAEGPILLAAGAASELTVPSLLATVSQAPLPVSVRAAKRPPALLPLYVTFAGLQALDLQSTYRALRNPAAREANPVARAVVGNRAAFASVKLATTAAFVLASERMWKKHPLAAIVFNVAGNSAMAAIVAHNYRIPGQ